VYWLLFLEHKINLDGLWVGVYWCLGYGLFRLDEWGRTFTLALLLFQLLINLFFALLIFRSIPSSAVEISGKPILILEGYLLATLPHWGWIVFNLVMAVFLLQRETRKVFLQKQIPIMPSESREKVQSQNLN
jgi:hypothetical protein